MVLTQAKAFFHFLSFVFVNQVFVEFSLVCAFTIFLYASQVYVRLSNTNLACGSGLKGTSLSLASTIWIDSYLGRLTTPRQYFP